MPQIRGKTQIQAGSIDAARLEASFNLPTAQLQDGALFLKSDGTVPLTTNLAAGGFRITGLGNPTAAGDAVNKAYADALIQGLDTKVAARVAIDTNFLLTGTSTVQTVTLAAGDRVLLIAQTNGAQNGPWVVAAGAWTRPIDYAAAATINPNAYIFVSEGTYADNGFTLTNNTDVVVDTTATTWTQFSGAGQVVAGGGLTKTGNTLDIGAGQGIQVDADSVTVRLDGATLTKAAAGLKVTDNTFALLSKLTTLSPQTLTGTVNGTNTVFTLPSAPLTGTVSVFLNGLLQRPTTDYTITGSTVTFVAAPSATGAADWVAATYITA
jgi:hypothetical protein